MSTFETPLTKPVDLLRPQSPLHEAVREKLRQRIDAARRAMQSFYSRWELSERRVQAYVNLPDYEELLKQQNESSQPPSAISIIVPYAFSTIRTIVTYLLHTFSGRKPIFQVGTYKAETAQSGRLMEMLLQYNADHERLVKVFSQWFYDAELYGVGVLRPLWRTVTRKSREPQMLPETLMGYETTGPLMAQVERTVFQGTQVLNVDPFSFLPDPRVPMTEVGSRGEFVFWQSFEGRHTLLKEEAAGRVNWVSAIPEFDAPSEFEGSSERAILSGGEAHPGRSWTQETQLDQPIRLEQGTVDLVPADWGLGDSDRPEKWLFCLANSRQIIQAEPYDADHGRHPVVVIEPYTLGYGFGQPGLSDYLGPLQDLISWFVDSHIHNVRAVLNNSVVVDPSRVEMQDLRTPKPGKIIRLKRAAYGQDPSTTITQLAIQDVTRTHIVDMQEVLRIGDTLSAVNDNLKGIQEAGGRKTATEVRTALEAGASRLAAHARLISAQGMVDLAEQMCSNYQQYCSGEFYVSVVGMIGQTAPLMVSPDRIAGDFYFPVSDGTLPYDKTAQLDIWKEIFMVLSSDPILGRQYDRSGIFEWMAELSGAHNLRNFKLQAAPPEMLQQQVQAGNAVPAEQAFAQLGGAQRRQIGGQGGTGGVAGLFQG